jgi:hypothetical protein
MTAAGRTSGAASPACIARLGCACVPVALVILLLDRLPVPVSAQTIEVSPFGGYRFGGDLFEASTNRPLDLDGAPVVGAAVDIEMPDGLWFETLFTHQQAHVDIPGDARSPPARVRAVVDHWLAGGRQEFGTGRARPFITGLVGLTYYGAGGDGEVRFTVGAGGGVKLRLHRRLALRLDSRVFTTFVDVDAHTVACSQQTCFIGVNVNIAWQAEFTAGLVLVLRAGPFPAG